MNKLFENLIFKKSHARQLIIRRWRSAKDRTRYSISRAKIIVATFGGAVISVLRWFRFGAETRSRRREESDIDSS